MPRESASPEAWTQPLWLSNIVCKPALLRVLDFTNRVNRDVVWGVLRVTRASAYDWPVWDANTPTNLAPTFWVIVACGEVLAWMASLTRAHRFDRLGPDLQVPA
jgi:hypothetical protein